jgi:hypothetical protein
VIRVIFEWMFHIQIYNKLLFHTLVVIYYILCLTFSELPHSLLFYVLFVELSGFLVLEM